MNANYRSIILALSLVFALSVSTSAAPGDLDPTFGSGGVVITRGSNPNVLDSPRAMAIQADGKIVVVGDGTLGTFNWDFAVVRYNPDGSLDSSFGGTGVVHTRLTSDYDGASAVAIQADGKIVVAGSRYNCFCVDSSFAVLRYNSDGSLDTSFNGTGIVITSVNSSRDYAQSVAIQADGKIVVAGSSGNGSIRDFALVRYNADGTLDTTFNGTGKVITPVSGGNFAGGANSVAIQADGKIVAAGSSLNGSTSAFALVRYNPDGTLDSSFNGAGKVITPVGDSDSGANQLAIQTDGKIVAGGYSKGATSDFAVARYNPNGSLDTSFGGTGKIIIPVGGSFDFAYTVAIQANGKIIAAGSSKNNTDCCFDFAVVRLNPNGSLDTTFNGTGKVFTAFGGQDYAVAAAIQADGKIVVAGGTDNLLFDFYDFAVVRYEGDAPTPAACPNPIDCDEFFVHQHYRDFLNREPDDAGLAFWTGEITSCGADAQCREAKRVNVSASFFLSIEFQETGVLVYRMWKAAYANAGDTPIPVRRADFLADAALVGQNVQVGVGNWQEQLEANKAAYANTFASRPVFLNKYGSMSNEQYVDALNLNAENALSPTERQTLLDALNTQTMTRAQVLRTVADDETLRQSQLRKVFVLMQYFGYLRRDPDAPGFDGQADPSFLGYQFWLGKLDQFNGNFVQAEMVKAFLSSVEYRQRFGQP